MSAVGISVVWFGRQTGADGLASVQSHHAAPDSGDQVGGRGSSTMLTMSRHQRLEEIFDEVLRLDEPERGSFLERECNGDPGLRQDLDDLLAAYSTSSGSFLEQLIGNRSPETGAREGPVSAPREPHTLPAPGERVAHYLIKRELGRGGMGAVYLARDTRLDRRVAIKFLLDAEPTLAERFMVEARALARCTHENIIAIHDVAEHRGYPFMVLEYQEGQTLRRWLQTHDCPLPIGHVLKLMLPVVRALVYAHGVGIVHRDLKPDNILVTNSSRIKVLDFGIAKLLTDPRQLTMLGQVPGRDMSMTQRGAILGTMPYMSPEQWGGEEIDHRSDIWAVGVMLFEMAIGRHPLAPLSPAKLFQVAALHVPMPKARTVAPELGTLADVIDLCLEKPKAVRLASAEALLARLEEAGRQAESAQKQEVGSSSPNVGATSGDDEGYARVRDPLARTSRLLARLPTDGVRLESALGIVRQAVDTKNVGADRSALGRSIRAIIQSSDLLAHQVVALLDTGSALLGLDTHRAHMCAILADKTRDFTGREYVFERIEQFCTKHSCGYLVIQAKPGLGKSSILAEYVRRTGCIAYFNSRSQGQVSVAQFLRSVCAQLIVDYGLPYSALPDGTEENGTVLQRLLQKASDKLRLGEKLVVVIDALDEADTSHQECANILCLPSNLPNGVYIIMSKRPVDLPLVTESPLEELDLMQFPEDNRRDVERYLGRMAMQSQVKAWIEAQQELSIADFVHTLAQLSENNFMYLRYVVPGIAAGEYHDLTIAALPKGLEAYYEGHWSRMGMNKKPLPRLEITIIYIMSEGREPMSRTLLTEILTYNKLETDAFAVQGILDEWSPFLKREHAEDGKRYSIYHASFRDFLNRKDIVQAAGVTIKDINALIAEYLWVGLMGE